MNITRKPMAQQGPRYSPLEDGILYNPQPMPEDSPNFDYMNVRLQDEVVEAHMYGTENVMEVLRRLKILGFTIIPLQEVIGNRRVVTWRIGINQNSQTIITYNLKWGYDWFGISECPCNVNEGVDYNTLYELGEGSIGPYGEFTFDDQFIIDYLEKIETLIC